MPADSQFDSNSSTQSYHILVGLIAGVVSFAALCLVFSRIGVKPMETVIFAALSAFTVTVFVSRERALAHQLAFTKRHSIRDLTRETGRINEIYDNSVASLVLFDAGSLHIERVSAGFFELLGIPANTNLSGANLEEVLGVDSTHLTSIAYQIKVGTMSVREELECKQANGQPLRLLITGKYLSHRHFVEAAFYRIPRNSSSLSDYEQMVEDLERFQKGIARRENRVLELKGEVNQLLKDAHKPIRYQVDSTTDDSRFGKRTMSMKEHLDHG